MVGSGETAAAERAGGAWCGRQKAVRCNGQPVRKGVSNAPELQPAAVAVATYRVLRGHVAGNVIVLTGPVQRLSVKRTGVSRQVQQQR